MSETEIMNLYRNVRDKRTDVSALTREQFAGLCGGMSRICAAKVFNCVDATGKSDGEWSMLSSVLSCAARYLSEKN